MTLIQHALACLACAAFAQTALAEETDNGTDPTKLRRSAWATYEYMDLGHDIQRSTYKLMFE